MTDTANLVGLNELVDWMAGAKQGDWFEYYRGFLIRGRHKDTIFLTTDEKGILNEVANRAWSVAQVGVIELVQKKIGFCEYSYRAVRTELPYGLAR